MSLNKLKWSSAEASNYFLLDAGNSGDYIDRQDCPKNTQIDGVGLERFPDDCDYFRVKLEIFAQIDQSIHFLHATFH